MGADRAGAGWAAVVLTGGTASRMGGTDKAGLEVGGTTLLDRALTAAAAAGEVVVVGDPAPTRRAVTWTREDPPGGGPAAGLLAGIDALRRPWELVAVLAVDMPGVTRATLDRLLAAVTGTGTVAGTVGGASEGAGAGADGDAVDGALLLDGDGRRQLLCGVHRVAALQRARPRTRSEEQGLAVRRLLAPLRLVEVPALADEARDVDTWEDLHALRERL